MNTSSNPSSNSPWNEIDKSLRRLIASARASKGMSWEDVAKAVSELGWDISAGNLMTRNSRMAFRADELIVLLSVLGVNEIAVHVPRPLEVSEA